MAITPKKPVRSRGGQTSAISRAQIDKFRRRATRLINETAMNVGEVVAQNLIKAYTIGLKSRLLNDGFEQAGDCNSKNIVRNIADSIHCDEYQCFVPIDKDGIILYLEYGTGLVGKENSNGYGEKHGWNYAVNRINYKTLRDYNPYRRYSGVFSPNFDPYVDKLGYVFKKDRNSYITKDDVDPMPFISIKQYWVKDKRWRYTKGYFRKDGTKVRGYRSKIKNKDARTIRVYKYDYTNRYNLAWSQGIKPIMFINRTKERLKAVLRRMDKNSGYVEFKKKVKGKVYRTAGNLSYIQLSDKAIKILNSIANGDWSNGGIMK